ncbi:MAG TPA: hypothetical protein VFR37_20100 [Longimicrobium sp.]|nr:hypothetical protein [Longimicrobium sp.]
MRSWHTQADGASEEAETADELLGVMFTTAKELRHAAEQVLEQEFIPTELLAEDERFADLVLRPAGSGEIRVRAERERHWYPFRVTRVDHAPR